MSMLGKRTRGTPICTHRLTGTYQLATLRVCFEILPALVQKCLQWCRSESYWKVMNRKAMSTAESCPMSLRNDVCRHVRHLQLLVCPTGEVCPAAGMLILHERPYTMSVQSYSDILQSCPVCVHHMMRAT